MVQVRKTTSASGASTMVMNAIERMENHASPKEPSAGTRGRAAPSISATTIPASSSSPPVTDPTREISGTGCAPFKQLGSREGKDVGFLPLGTPKPKAPDSRRGAGRRSGSSSNFEGYSSSSTDGIVISFGCLDEIVTGSACNVMPPVSDEAAKTPAAAAGTANASRASHSHAPKTGSCKVSGRVSSRGLGVATEDEEGEAGGGVAREQGQAGGELDGSGTPLPGGNGPEDFQERSGTSSVVRDEVGSVAQPVGHKKRGSDGEVSAADAVTTSVKGTAFGSADVDDGSLVEPGVEDAPIVRDVGDAGSTVVDATIDFETASKVASSTATSSPMSDSHVDSAAGCVSDGPHGNTNKVATGRVNETSEKEGSVQERSANNSSAASRGSRPVNASVARAPRTAPRRLNPRAAPFTFNPPSASRPCATSDVKISSSRHSKTAKKKVSTVNSSPVAVTPDAVAPAADVALKKGKPDADNVDVVREATLDAPPSVELTVPVQPPPAPVEEQLAPAGALSASSREDDGATEVETGTPTDDACRGSVGGDVSIDDDAADGGGGASGGNGHSGGAVFVVDNERMGSKEISTPVGLPVSVLCKVVLHEQCFIVYFVDSILHIRHASATLKHTHFRALKTQSLALTRPLTPNFEPSKLTHLLLHTPSASRLPPIHKILRVQQTAG